jgi:hypothetical protein
MRKSGILKEPPQARALECSVRRCSADLPPYFGGYSGAKQTSQRERAWQEDNAVRWHRTMPGVLLYERIVKILNGRFQASASRRPSKRLSRSSTRSTATPILGRQSAGRRRAGRGRGKQRAEPGERGKHRAQLVL